MPEADGEDKRGQPPEIGRKPVRGGADQAQLARPGSGEQGVASQAGADGAGYPVFGKESWDRLAAAARLSAREIEIAWRIFPDPLDMAMAGVCHRGRRGGLMQGAISRPNSREGDRRA